MILPAAGHAGAALCRGGAARAGAAGRPVVRLTVGAVIRAAGRAIIGLTVRAVIRAAGRAIIGLTVPAVIGLAVHAAVTVVIVVRTVHAAIRRGRYVAAHPVRADAARRAAPGQHKRQQADCQQADPDSSHIRFLPK